MVVQAEKHDIAGKLGKKNVKKTSMFFRGFISQCLQKDTVHFVKAVQ
jgi:hypothetical protein